LAGHWWDANLTDGRRTDRPVRGACLNVDNAIVPSINKALFHKKLVVIKDVYKNETNAGLPGCGSTDLTLFMDQEFFVKHYCDRYYTIR
jgi:hypothetical protein